MKKESYLKGRIKIEKAENKITVIASDETLDRHGDVLPIEQWDLSKFKLSPRMLVDHNHEVASIVGKWVNPRIKGATLLMDAVFHEFTDLSRAVKQMVEEGFLDTVSVGFIYNGPEKNGDRPSFELIETSWVTVPANPNARVVKMMEEVKGKSISEEDVNKIKDFTGDTNEIEESDDILPEDEEEPMPSEIEDELSDEGIIVESIDSFNKNKFDKEVISCSVGFIEQLVSDSEKLKTLTQKQKAKVEAEKSARFTQLVLKEAARNINQTLHQLNKAE